MADAAPDQALIALLALETEEPRSPAVNGRAQTLKPLPTLDERVDLFLFALHGSKHSFTAKERATVRNRILSTMAAELAGEIDDETFRGIDRIAANAAVPTTATPAMVSSVGHTARSIGAMLRDALLLPLMIPALGSGRMRMVTASLMILLIVGAGWSATWFYAARSAETAIASWIDGEAKSGRSYDCGSRTVSGFPLHVEVRCIEPKATLALGQSTLVVSAKELRSTASILQPDVLSTEITGPMSVIGESRSASYVGNWTLARTIVHGLSSNPEQVSVTVDGLQLYRVSQINMEPVLAGDRLEFGARRALTSASGVPAFNIAARISDASIADGGAVLSQPFAADISAVIRDVRSTTPKALIARLQEWQSGGGRLDITSARIQQGDAIAIAAGNIGLDQTGHIQGALQVATSGPYQQLAQVYIQNGQHTAERERLAQSILGDARTHSRSIDKIQRTERELQREAAERESQRTSPAQRLAPNTNANLPAPPNAPNLPTGGSIEVPIRFVDGAVYLGSVLLGLTPPLY